VLVMFVLVIFVLVMFVLVIFSFLHNRNGEKQN